MENIKQAGCPECNVAYITTHKKSSVSFGGLFGAFLGLIGIFVAILGSFIAGIVLFILGILIGSASAKNITMLVCPQCKKKVTL